MHEASAALAGASLVLVGAYLFLMREKKMPMNIQGPPGSRWPLNKYAFDFFGRFSELHLVIKEWVEKHGEISSLSLFGTDMIVISDTELIKKIFANRASFQHPPDFKKALSYSFGENGSMFSSEGDEWARRHAIVLPMQKINFMKFHALTVGNTMRKTVKLLELMDLEKDVQVVPILKRATLDVIGQSVFGIDFHVIPDNTQDLQETPQLAKDFQEILSAIVNRLLTSKLSWPLHYYFSGERASALRLKKFFSSLIQERRELIAKDPHTDRVTLLDLILKHKAENPDDPVYPDTAILQECLSFFGAGHDTTSLTLSFFLWHLAMYPHIQQKIYEEVMELVQQKQEDEIPSYDDLSKLDYLACAIKESQRILPVVTSLTRHVTQDTQINGLNFPKGTMVVLSTWTEQTSAKYYENPEEMEPSRWRREGQGVNEHKERPFYPFGHGTRACFGQKLALLEIKLFVYFLLQRFEVRQSAAQNEVTFFFGLAPKRDQLFVRLLPRS